MHEQIGSWLQTPEDALNFIKVSTWIVTGLVTVVVIMRAMTLLLAFKGLSKEEKTKEVLSIIAGLCMIGIFWCVFFIWGESIAAGYA